MRIWYRNNKDTQANVRIFLEGETTEVASFPAAGNAGDAIEIPCSNKSETSYY